MILLRPFWLLAFAVLAVFAWRLLARGARLGAWDRAVDPELLRAMMALGHVERARGLRPLWAAFAAMGLMILALAGPAVERRDMPSFRNLDGVLFVMDLSDSVTAHPDWAELLSTARYGLSRLGSRPAGLIVFAGDAYPAQAMTYDHLALGQSLFLLDAQTVPNAGSRPALGLELAARTLTQADVIAGDVVLFTDGAGLGPRAVSAAQALAQLGARLSVVTLAPDPGAQGQDVAQVQSVAAAGQGRVFALAEADALGDWLAQGTAERLRLQDIPLLYWFDLGPYLVLMAMVPLIFLFRWQV